MLLDTVAQFIIKVCACNHAPYVLPTPAYDNQNKELITCSCTNAKPVTLGEQSPQTQYADPFTGKNRYRPEQESGPTAKSSPNTTSQSPSVPVPMDWESDATKKITSPYKHF